ncbi:MAG: hypothetical protein QT11_C0001G0907 [archaeon GW2011_AR20]|nr:MAG: hypothetical protein QT11_C0001G0907 [archaeon GW2011_AR20]MBS3160132.1 HIT family protein [Candidatus Woesearchaeota archaeon]
MIEECIFCEGKLEKYLIKKFEHWIVYLNPQQYYLGRVYVVLNRHEPENTFELTDEEWKEFKEVIDKVTKVLKSLYKYDLMNYLTLQNKDRNHFYMHLIPRYKDIRIVNGGEEFKDELWGNPPFPSPKKEVEEKLLQKIKEDIQKEL